MIVRNREECGDRLRWEGGEERGRGRRRKKRERELLREMNGQRGFRWKKQSEGVRRGEMI